MTIFADDPSRTAWTAAFLQGIPYARESGMKAVDVHEGRARLLLPARDAWTGDAHNQQMHPGCATVLADTACGVAVGTALTEMVPFATLDLRMDYLRPARAGGDLVCDAHCHRLSRSVAFVRGEVFQPGTDEPVAAVNATFMLSTARQRRTDLPPKGADGTTAPSAGPTAPQEGLVSAPASPPGRSPYVDFLAIERWADPCNPGSALFRMPFRPELIGNPVLPALHGGVVAGFAETAAILHLLYTNDLPAEAPPRGVDFSVDYLRSAKPVDTWARCTTVRQGSRVALVHVQVWQDDASRPIVTARSHCLLPQQAG